MMNAMGHCQRPWWERPPFWFAVIIAALLLIMFTIEQTDRPALTPYSTFLDQLEAGNIASVTFHGTQIDGRYKHLLDGASSSSQMQLDSFSSRVPDFGDPALIPELRKKQVVINVSSPSQWTSVLSHLPWPMLIFIGVAILAGLLRLVHGGKPQSGSAVSPLPMHGIMGLVSRLFVKRDQTEIHPATDSDDTKSR